MRLVSIAGYSLSQIVLGTDYYGTTVQETDAFALIDRYRAHGGNAFDCARIYGSGASEGVLGRYIAARGCREEIVLITTGGHIPGQAPAPRHFSRAFLEEELRRSLDALGLPSVDFYLLHRDCEDVPVGEIMETLARLVGSGAVRHIGCSNWSCARIEAANAYAAAHSLPAFALSEIQWSLAACSKEAWGDDSLVFMTPESERWYQARQMPVLAYSPQARGLFAKTIAHGLAANSEKALRRFASPENLARVERVRAFSQARGVSPSAVVLAYLLSADIPALPIIGCKTPAQLDDSLSAAALTLTPEERQYLHSGRPAHG